MVPGLFLSSDYSEHREKVFAIIMIGTLLLSISDV